MTASTLPPEAQAGNLILERRQALDRTRERHNRRRFTAVQATRVALAAAVLLLWQWAVTSGHASALFFSRPTAIWDYLKQIFANGSVWTDTGVTLKTMALAFVIGSAAGIAAAIAGAMLPFVSDVLDPFITLLNSLPRVALAPLFIIWFGIGEASKVALAVSLVFFIVLISAEAGFKTAEEEQIRLLQSMRASKLTIFRKVQLRAAVPAIFGGLRLAIVYSLLGVVFGEMIASQRGLGHQLEYNASTFNTAGVMAYLLVLAIVALLINALVVASERYFLRWQR
jgi:NitT/TauT family transport system permease protein